MPVTVEEKGEDFYKKVVSSLHRVARKRVLVGIPSKNDKRPDGQSNAMLAYIHNFGSPLQGIPPRPHIIPGIEKERSNIEAHLKAALQAAFEGEQALRVDKHLRDAGQTAVNSIRGMIQAKLKPDLADETIRRRRQRSRGSKYRRKAQAAHDTTPLWDTGNYINHITYVIRNKGGSDEDATA